MVHVGIVKLSLKPDLITSNDEDFPAWALLRELSVTGLASKDLCAL